MARKGYVQLVNSFYLNWKVRKLRTTCPTALGVFTMVLSYCGDNLSDGRISDNDLRYVIGASDDEINALCGVEMLVPAHGSEYYTVHDYLKHNRSHAQVTRKRDVNAHAYARATSENEARLRETSDNATKTQSESEVLRPNMPETSDSDGKTPSESGQTPEHQNTRTPEHINTPPTPSTGDYTLDFEQFWETYPRKEGKRDAFDAFQHARRKTNKMTLLAVAQRYASDPNRDPKYTLTPAKWLKGEHWLDQPLPARKPQATGAQQRRDEAMDRIERFTRMDEQPGLLQLGGVNAVHA